MCMRDERGEKMERIISKKVRLFFFFLNPCNISPLIITVLSACFCHISGVVKYHPFGMAEWRGDSERIAHDFSSPFEYLLFQAPLSI